MYIPELRTRALETHTFVMAANRAGYEQVEGEETPRYHFGRSCLIGPIGDVLDSTDDTEWTYVSGEFDTDRIEWRINAGTGGATGGGALRAACRSGLYRKTNSL
jgi:predicted amidohydrolase